MNYRDPLFSVIVFFIIVLITVLVTLGIGRLRQYFKDKEIEELLNDFEYVEIEEIKPEKSNVNALLLLAQAFEMKGDYEKALKIYLLMEKEEKSVEILKKIANVYFKAGFLHKAREMCYKILKIHPRDKEALKLLIWVDEKLGFYKEIVDIIEIFDELEIEMPKEKANALIKLLTKKQCDISEFCEGFNDFEDIYREYPFVKREYLEYLFKKNPKKAFELADAYEHIDLFFYRDDIPDEEKFCNVLAAKKLKKCEKKAPFEIEVLKHLPENLAELEFEYICRNCKKTFPLYSTRCPNCHELFSQKLIMKISPKNSVENIEF